jgi:glycosyltransferase involved in cell wall biosynthesis
MRPLRIAVLKPDYGVSGGFERVVLRAEAVLRDAGHRVVRHSVDMTPPRREVFGGAVPDAVWDAAPEYFGYLHGRDRFDRVDTRAYDLVLSTQPPSFLHRHPRHLALFYHHHRVYYDLEATYLAAGFAADPEVHRAAGVLLRDLDQPRFEAVTHFLTPSDTVAARLQRFNGLTNTARFLAGVGVDGATDTAAAATPPGTGAVLCVGRHEFPKRVELLVAAAHLLPRGQEVLCIGAGGRKAWAEALDARLSRGEVTPDELDDAALWCNTGRELVAPTGPAIARTTFTGWVDDDELTRRYREAPCVVAPALDEDYGLTAIEAMAHGRPVVVCRDGGGLAELVEHGRTGLVVEPTPAAIAAAVQRLVEDRDLAAELGANGRDRAAELSWANAGAQLLAGVEATMDAPAAAV